MEKAKMKFVEYMALVANFALEESEETKIHYIKPLYAFFLAMEHLDIDDKENCEVEIEDFSKATMEFVHRQLELECAKRNAQADKTGVVMNWLCDMMTTTIEPAVLDEQNEMLKDLIEYRKQKNAIDDRTKELDAKEKKIEQQQMVMPDNMGFAFSKKKP